MITLRDQLRATWNTRNKYALAAVTLIVAAISWHDIPHLGMSTLEVVIGTFALVTTVLMMVLLWAVIVAVAVTFTSLRQSKDQRAISYEVGADSIVVRDRTGMALTTPWTVVRRATESARAFRLELKPMGSRYIPKRAFAAADLIALRGLIGEKLGGKAKLRKA